MKFIITAATELSDYPQRSFWLLNRTHLLKLERFTENQMEKIHYKI